MPSKISQLLTSASAVRKIRAQVIFPSELIPFQKKSMMHDAENMCIKKYGAKKPVHKEVWCSKIIIFVKTTAF